MGLLEDVVDVAEHLVGEVCGLPDEIYSILIFV